MNESIRKNRTNKIKLNMILGFTSLIIVMVFLIIAIFNIRMGNAMKVQTADMIEHLNGQIGNNIDTFMINLSDNADILCYDKQVKEFGHEEGHSRPEEREELDDKIKSYAMSSSYENFCVVYSNEDVLGTISDSTLEQYREESLFQKLRTILTVKAAGTWTNELLPDHSIVSYVKLIDNDAIVLVSVSEEYVRHLFDNSIFIEGMNVYLVNSSLIIQSTTDSSIGPGSYLKTHIYRLVNRSADSTKIGDLYVVSNKKLVDGWFIVTAVPSGEILRPLNSTIGYIVLLTGFAVLLAVIFTVILSNNIVRIVEQTVDKLDVKAQTDLLTGLINKRSFEEIVQLTLENPEDNMSYALVFMDVDNFKGVNDKCGHDIGDEVLRSFAHTIGQVFREGDIKGRLGGDEFCVLMKLPLAEKQQMVNDVNEVCKRFRDALHRKASSARQSLPAVTSSMGAAMWDGVPEAFGSLYHKADVAVYASKKRGKDTWSVYGQDDVTESIVQD